MSDIDTAAIREHYNSPAFTGRSTPDIEALCDEIDRLRADRKLWHETAQKFAADEVVKRHGAEIRLRKQVEAERDALASRAARIFERSAEPDPVAEENDRLRARLAAVERIRDWMGQNNDDAAYDLAIVALNRALIGEGDRPSFVACCHNSPHIEGCENPIHDGTD